MMSISQRSSSMLCNSTTVLWPSHLSQSWGWNQVGSFSEGLCVDTYTSSARGAMGMLVPVWLGGVDSIFKGPLATEGLSPALHRAQAALVLYV